MSLSHTSRPSASSRGRALVLAALAAVAVAIVPLSTPAPAAASLATSSTFDDWTTASSGSPAPDFTFTADTGVTHSGAASLKLTYGSDYSGTRYAHAYQDVTGLTAGATYSFSAWVRTLGVAQADGAYFVVTSDHSVKQALPTGTTGWSKLEWSYTLPADAHSFRMRLLMKGPGTIWADDLTMTGPGSTANLLKNPSFDAFGPAPGTLAFADTALVYTAGSGQIAVDTLADSITWSIDASSGQRVDSGTAAASSGRTTIDVSSLPTGYYTVNIAIASPPVARVETFAVVAPRSSAITSDHPIGVAVHVNRNSVAQVDALMEPLGAGMLREGPAWASIENPKGTYTWPALFDAQLAAAKARGERPLVILAYDNPNYDGGKTPSSPEGIAGFAAYASAAAAHYGADVDYEIYNEYNYTFNDGDCGRTADCYLPLLAAAADAVHTAAPGARVVGPVLAGDDTAWLERLFQLGGLSYLDVVSYHTYDFPNAPEGRTEARIAAVRSLIDGYAPAGKNVPIWLTEHGWTTTAGGTTEQQQAAYSVRAAIELRAAGVERVFYYDLIDDGTDPGEVEHNFGLVRLASGGGTTLSPKPAYAALAVFDRLTAGHQLASLQRSNGAYLADYGTVGGTRVQAIWSTSGTKTFTATAGSSAQVVQGDGRAWKLKAGAVQLTVGPDPVFVTGGVVGLAVTATAAVQAQTPASIPVDTDIQVPVTIDRSALGATGPVVVAGPAGAGTTLGDAGSGAVQGSAALAAFRELGQKPLAYTVRQGDAVLAYVASAASVVENPTVTLAPSATSGTVGQEVVARNADVAPAVSLGSVDWTVGGTSGTLAAATLAPGQTSARPVDVSGSPAWEALPYTLAYAVGGAQRTVAGRTALAGVAADGDDPVQVGWRDKGAYIPLGGTAADPTVTDLGGWFALSWSPDGLHLVSEATDDEDATGTSADRMWASDSLQIATTRGLPGTQPATWTELTIGRVGQTPTVYRTTGTPGTVATDLVVDRDAATGTTRYDVTIPWATLQLDPVDGVFSFSALVNDADAGARQGIAEWAGGIGTAKDPRLFLPVALLPAAG